MLRVLEKYNGHPRELDTQPLFFKHEILSARSIYNLKLLQHIDEHKLQDAFPRTVSRKYGSRNFTRKTEKIRTNCSKQVGEDCAVVQLLRLCSC